MRANACPFILPLLLLSFSVFAEALSPDPVVARVASRTLLASDVKRRLLELPEYQRAALSQGHPDLAGFFTESVLIPELLYALEAEERHLAEDPRVKDKVRAILDTALIDNLRAEVLSTRPIREDEIRNYYESYSDEFQIPKALRLWRILVFDRKLAQQIIEEARTSDGVNRWSAQSREHSLDRATHERKGDLGFVRADGSTDVPSLRVESALYAAAEAVKDGEVVPEPVPMGDNFAVIWRRGTRAEVKQTLSEVAPHIRRVLENQRVEQALQALLANLSQEQVRDKDASPIEQLKMSLDR